MRKQPGEEDSEKADTYYLLGCKQYKSDDFTSALRSFHGVLAIRRKLHEE